MLQKLRDAERDITFGEYAGREGDIVTGIVQQQDHRYTILDLGKTEALMPPSEQIPHERYEHGSRLKAYIVEVRRSARGPQIDRLEDAPGVDQAAVRARGPRDPRRHRRDQSRSRGSQAIVRRSPWCLMIRTSIPSALASEARDRESAW